MKTRRFSRGGKKLLKYLTLRKWHKNGKFIFCFECGSIPKIFNDVVCGTVCGKKYTIKSPEGFTFHILRPDKVNLDLLNDTGFRCHSCYTKYYENCMKKDNGNIIDFNKNQKNGGDIWNNFKRIF